MWLILVVKQFCVSVSGLYSFLCSFPVIQYFGYLVIWAFWIFALMIRDCVLFKNYYSKSRLQDINRGFASITIFNKYFVPVG